MKDNQRYHREFISCNQKVLLLSLTNHRKFKSYEVYEVISFLTRDEKKAYIPLVLALGFTLMKGQYSKCQLSFSLFGGELTFRVILLDPRNRYKQLVQNSNR